MSTAWPGVIGPCCAMSQWWCESCSRDALKAAVLGAGIMGGGIAYQSALRGTPIVMKDIAQAGLDLGLSEAAKLVGKQVKRGKMSVEAGEKILGGINATLSYEEVVGAELIVEAVIEQIKKYGEIGRASCRERV